MSILDKKIIPIVLSLITCISLSLSIYNVLKQNDMEKGRKVQVNRNLETIVSVPPAQCCDNLLKIIDELKKENLALKNEIITMKKSYYTKKEVDEKFKNYNDTVYIELNYLKNLTGFFVNKKPTKVYRVFNPTNGDHMTTIGGAELNLTGWKKDKVEFWAFVNKTL